MPIHIKQEFETKKKKSPKMKAEIRVFNPVGYRTKSSAASVPSAKAISESLPS